MRRKDTLYCEICDGKVILPSPAFLSSNFAFVANHIDSIEHLENLNKITHRWMDGEGISVVSHWIQSVKA